MTTVQTPRRSVGPRAIPEALRAIWRECCAGEEGSTVSRALTTNLVVVVQAAREPEIRKLLGGLSTRLPCRAFLIAVDPSDGGITAEVHGAARLHGSTRDLVLEQIELRVPEREFERLPGIVRPLLVADVPTRLYWGCDLPRELKRFDAFAAMADQSIVDSGRFELPAHSLDAVETRRRRGMRLFDLNWLRLRPWRRALAEVFERAPYREHAATHATIRFGGDAMAAGNLLGRWLEKRLGARISLEAADAPGSGLLGVDLLHADIRAALRLASPGRIEVAVETDAACFLPFAVAASMANEGDLLAAAIDIG